MLDPAARKTGRSKAALIRAAVRSVSGGPKVADADLRTIDTMNVRRLSMLRDLEAPS